MIRGRVAAVLLADVVALSAAAACSGGHAAPPAPIPIVSTTTFTTLADHSSETLLAVNGETTLPPVGVTPGRAVLNGNVVDDTGAPVAGATVELQRIVGGRVGTADVATGADGTWVAQGIGGGVYRVRAWRAPDLAQTSPQVLFLAATATQTVNLTVAHFTGTGVQSSVAPNPPIIGEPANIVVQVTGMTVGADGIARAAGIPGVPVQLFGEGAWVVSGDGSAVTSSRGFVSFQAVCEELGSQGLSVLVNSGQAYTVNVGACSPVPTTTTSTTSTTVPGETTTTTTTRRKGKTTTTTTH